MLEKEKYDVAFSFASEDRDFVSSVARYLIENNVRVFYDAFEQISLWGEHLPETLDRVYRHESRFVVVFISQAYAKSIWTRFEIRSIISATMNLNTSYMLPARFDDTELPGIQPTIAYIDLRNETASTFSDKILQKLRNAPVKPDNAPVFTDTNDFNVLILPFDPIEKIPNKQINPERAIVKRLLDLKDDENLSLMVTYLERGILPLSFEDGVSVGRKNNANLVVWGDYYQEAHTERTNMRIRWASTNNRFPNVASKGKTPIIPLDNLTFLSEGGLQKDIDYIIFWCIAQIELANKHYEKATQHLETVAVKFGDKFAGIVSMGMNETGFSIKIERPAVQLLYYLGLCYQEQGNFDKAVACWNHILSGSAGGKGKNSMAWDSLALAIANNDREAAGGLLYILLCKAHAYVSLGNVDAALEDFQRIYKYGKMAEDSQEFYSQIFKPVITWITEDLQIAENEKSQNQQVKELISKLFRKE